MNITTVLHNNFHEWFYHTKHVHSFPTILCSVTPTFYLLSPVGQCYQSTIYIMLSTKWYRHSFRKKILLVNATMSFNYLRWYTNWKYSERVKAQSTFRYGNLRSQAELSVWELHGIIRAGKHRLRWSVFWGTLSSCMKTWADKDVLDGLYLYNIKYTAAEWKNFRS